MTGAAVRAELAGPAGWLRPVAAPLQAAVALIAGIWLADWWPLPVTVWLSLSGVCVLLAGAWLNRGRSILSVVALLCGSVCLGGTLWSLQQALSRSTGIRQYLPAASAAQQVADTVRVTGTIASIPSLRSRREAMYRAADGTAVTQTLFLLQLHSLQLPTGTQPVAGQLRILVDGAATASLNWGDQVAVAGRLETEFSVGNPGEFDFGAFLRHQSIAGVLFVPHARAVDVQLSVPAWHPLAGLSRLRRAAVGLLQQHVQPAFRPLAEALLLGNRGHLDPETERDFVFSGTMHLLSISGLHVGVLYVFLVRVLHLLLVRRRYCLLWGLAFCVGYTLLTDLRPSVVRSTLFIVLTVLAQLARRNVRLQTLIGNTALVLVLWTPGVAFDVGAWLSFLAVAALAWAADVPERSASREAPPDSLTWRERLRELRTTAAARLTLRYRQMFGIALFSMPLVAAQFHVVSLSGVLVNLLLIPLTGGAMISGFLLVGGGLLLPPIAWLPGAVFNGLLSALTFSVEQAAALRLGALSIPDIPTWFLLVYYGLLATVLLCARRRVVLGCWSVLAVLVLTGFWRLNQPVTRSELLCTVLSVGHGNAVVVETPDGRTLVFDAGALNRAERTADIVARFLWHQGHRQIDALVISHADLDHYNAVRGLADRMPIGRLLTTAQWTASPAQPVQELLRDLQRRAIDVRQVCDGDSLQLGDVRVQFQQAVPPAGEQWADNELSLVARVTYAGRSVTLPGDLEQRGEQLLADRLLPADVLVSPHHGSRTSNTALIARTLAPQAVVVSARTAATDDWLRGVYGPATELWNTSQHGAVTIVFAPAAAPRITAFRRPQPDQS